MLWSDLRERSLCLMKGGDVPRERKQCHIQCLARGSNIWAVHSIVKEEMLHSVSNERR